MADANEAVTADCEGEEATEGAKSAPLKVAVAGCIHGELDRVYETLRRFEYENACKVDILLCCGDFQAVRNMSDLVSMACPPKYQSLQSFYKYYSGESEAPVLTVFVGGNHEASNYLSELPYGGWVAPNIYYLGYAGVVRFGGLRIAGLSGIFNGRHYNLGHYECPPYSGDTMRSAYHVRNLEMFRLRQLRRDGQQCVDAFVSHDWPAGVVEFGDKQALLRVKPFFREDIERGRLGNPRAMELLRELRPRLWFAAHLHCRFAAIVPHDGGDGGGGGGETRFLALDKPLPRRHFFQVVDVEPSSADGVEPANRRLQYDLEWLAILRSTNHLLSVNSRPVYMPGPGGGGDERHDFRPTADEIAAVKALFATDDLTVAEQFCQTAPPHPARQAGRRAQALAYRNPQTSKFCGRFGLANLNEMFCEMRPDVVDVPVCLADAANPDEIQLDDEAFDGDDAPPFVIDTAARGDGGSSAMAASSHYEPPALKRSAAAAAAAADDSGEPVPPDSSCVMKRRNAAMYEASVDDP